MTTGNGRRRIRGEALDDIRTLTWDGWSPGQIHAHIEEKYGEGVANLRTVQRIAKSLTPRDATEEFSAGDAASPEAAWVYECLAYIAQKSDGRVLSLSKREASWIIRVRRITAVTPVRTLEMAREFMLREDQGADTVDLDLWLAFAKVVNDCESDDRAESWATIHADLHARSFPDRVFRPLAGTNAVMDAWANRLGIRRPVDMNKVNMGLPTGTKLEISISNNAPLEGDE